MKKNIINIFYHGYLDTNYNLQASTNKILYEISRVVQV